MKKIMILVAVISFFSFSDDIKIDRVKEISWKN